MSGDFKKQNLKGLIVMTVAAVILIAVAGPLQQIVASLIPAPSGLIVYKQVEAPATSRENGVITADEWESVYPEIVASYRANDDILCLFMKGSGLPRIIPARLPIHTRWRM